MKRVALVAAAVGAGGVAVFAFGGSDPISVPLAGRQSPSPLYAVDFAAHGGRVVRFDAASLRAHPGPSVRVHDHLMGWSFSRDRSRLALGTHRRGTIRVVDTIRMRLLAELETGVRGPVLGTHWLAGRVVAAVGTQVVVVDPVSRRVVARGRLGRQAVAVARTSEAFLLLLPPRAGIGASTLAAVDRRGRVRSIALDRIASGRDARFHSTGLQRYAMPALTLEPSGRRAFVVAADALVAEVDLRSSRVDYHSLAEPVSLFGRLRNWLEPKAAAKGAAVGPRRDAKWLGARTIAVWGTDDRGSVDARGVGHIRREAAGVRLIDMRDWSVRTLDRDGSDAVVADRVLLVSAALWDSTRAGARGIGLRGYGPDGSLRFRVLGSAALAAVQVVGKRAIVTQADRSGRERYTIVDLRTGRVAAVLRPRESFMLLNGPAASWLGY